MLDTLIIESPLNGKLIELSGVNDKIFSSGAAGRGVAIKNPDGKISAPFDGIVKFLASPGVIGESFKPQVEADDTIRRGQILLTFDPQEVIRAGFDATTPVVVTNPENFGDIIFLLGEQKIHLTNEKYLQYNLRGGVEYGKFIAAT